MEKKVFLIITLLMCTVLCFAKEPDINKDTYIFIDISGSTSESFNEIQDYAINEMVSKLNKDTNLSIYKFYGKCVNIYDQKLKTDFDFEYAKERIQNLLPNGPWTNLDLVKNVIKERNIDLTTSNVFILTDGHQELENGENNYSLSSENISDYLEDCELINQGTWFILVYKYKEKTAPVNIETNEEPTSVNIEPKVPVEPSIPQSSNMEKKSYRFNFDIFRIIIFILFWLCLLIWFVSIISYIIWDNLKNKSVKLKQFLDYRNKCFWKYAICLCCIILNLVFFILYFKMLFYIQIIFIILSLGSTIYVSIISVKLLISNSQYSIKIYKIYHRLTKEEYVDIPTLYDIKSSDCNYVLYLKRKKISDLNFSSNNIEKNQIVLGIALKKINDSNAIGIQKGKSFYFLNLELIFEKLNIKLSIDERKQISKIIANTYGNDKLDKIDWALASSIGLITGLMDIFFVGKPDDSKLQRFFDGNEEKIVKVAAKVSGIDVKNKNFQEKFQTKYWVPYDKVNIKEIGMWAGNHHLISLAHANDMIGLFFSIMDTRMSIKKTIENNGILYRVVTCVYDKNDLETIEAIRQNSNLEFVFGGTFVRLVEPFNKKDEVHTVDEYFKSAKKEDKKSYLIQQFEKLMTKITYKAIYDNCKDKDELGLTLISIISGFGLWLMHLYTDKAGSSSTKEGNRGTGVAAPYQELFTHVDLNFIEKFVNKGEEKLHQAVKDVGKEMFEKGFDNRFFKAQKIPVLINEYLTKITFICKEVFYYKKELEIKDIFQILCSEGIIKTSARVMTGNSNFELEKTLTISFSIFSIVDISDAIINNESTIDKLLSINYAGLIKLGKESLSVFLSYLRRWSASPDKIIRKIEKLAENMVVENEEPSEIEEKHEISVIDFVE